MKDILESKSVAEIFMKNNSLFQVFALSPERMLCFSNYNYSKQRGTVVSFLSADTELLFSNPTWMIPRTIAISKSSIATKIKDDSGYLWCFRLKRKNRNLLRQELNP